MGSPILLLGPGHTSTARRGRTPRGEQRDKLSWMPETGDGETWGQFGAAPAPRRVPGRPAADRAHDK